MSVKSLLDAPTEEKALDARTGGHMLMNIPKLEILEFKARLDMHLETQQFHDEYDASKYS
jgi:phage pi2 protein 07